MFKRLLLLLSVSALAVPVAAAAAPSPRQTVTISGSKIALVGRAFVKAELTASTAAKPVRVLGRAGFMRFVDLGGDLRVRCQGRAFVKAELTASTAARPVRLLGRAGFMRFVDLGGDLKVRCQGRGDAQGHKNDKGQTVFLCAGAGGRAEATGSHFAIQGFALRYGLAIPDGYTGTVEGRVREWQPGQDGARAPGAGQGQSQSDAASSIDADLAAALAQG